MKAWYFAEESRKLRYEDNRPIILGETHSVTNPEKLEFCNYGLHASKRIIDALQYAPGCILYEVELSGRIIESTDKVVAEHRKYLREIDATSILREFARKQALLNIKKIRSYCSSQAYTIILDWLNTGDSSIQSAAQSAAWAAALAAESTAESAAALAAESAAESARSARAAARAAAWAAAESARSTWSAWSAAANEMLLKMVTDKL